MPERQCRAWKADAEAVGAYAEAEEASVGDAEGQRADAKSQEANADASIVAQRLAELTQGQEAALETFVRQTEAKRVMQSLAE